jgi:hypothetical protein
MFNSLPNFFFLVLNNLKPKNLFCETYLFSCFKTKKSKQVMLFFLKVQMILVLNTGFHNIFIKQSLKTKNKIKQVPSLFSVNYYFLDLFPSDYVNDPCSEGFS